jgi:hypothetical protein
VDRWMDQCVDEWMGGLVDGWMDGWISNEEGQSESPPTALVLFSTFTQKLIFSVSSLPLSHIFHGYVRVKHQKSSDSSDSY